MGKSIAQASGRHFSVCQQLRLEPGLVQAVGKSIACEVRQLPRQRPVHASFFYSGTFVVSRALMIVPVCTHGAVELRVQGAQRAPRMLWLLLGELHRRGTVDGPAALATGELPQAYCMQHVIFTTLCVER